MSAQYPLSKILCSSLVTDGPPRKSLTSEQGPEHGLCMSSLSCSGTLIAPKLTLGGRDFADKHPGAHVTGTDVSTIQPTWIPPNLQFEIDDCNESWTWKSNSVDFIHMRGLLGSVTDWSALYKNAFRCCKVGGYFEDHEWSVQIQSDDGSLTEESALGQWCKVFWEGGKKFGRTFRVLEDDVQESCMKEAGFQNVVVQNFKVPIGIWPREQSQRVMGLFAREVLEVDCEGQFLPP